MAGKQQTGVRQYARDLGMGLEEVELITGLKIRGMELCYKNNIVLFEVKVLGAIAYKKKNKNKPCKP